MGPKTTKFDHKKNVTSVWSGRLDHSAPQNDQGRCYKLRLRFEILYRTLYACTLFSITAAVCARNILVHLPGTPVELLLYIYGRKKRSRTSPHSPGPQSGTLTTASGRDDEVDVSHRSSRVVVDEQALLAEQLVSYHCCCILLWACVFSSSIQSRHDALDSPSTRHLGAVTALLGSKELRAERRHVLGDVGVARC